MNVSAGVEARGSSVGGSSKKRTKQSPNVPYQRQAQDVEQLELFMRQHGLHVPGMGNDDETGKLLAPFAQTLQIKQEPEPELHLPGVLELMDDSPVCGDPMMSSPLEQSRASSAHSMDDLLDDHDYPIL